MRRTISSLSTVSVVFLASVASGDASAASAGPDAFGYAFVDQVDGAVYNYVDITLTGTEVIAVADDSSVSVPMGAPFEVYGVPLMDMVATTNGVLTDDLNADGDLSNDCPVPDPPSTGGGFRIYPLHDDLDTAIYYQYFNEMEAAAIGYPGETAGISIFQWVGFHHNGMPGVDDVNTEAVLFHDDFSILTMVQADSEGGSSSTLGIQNSDASIGLNYVCNTGMSVVPGVTAVQYTLGPAPDSDCCTESPSGAPGCVNETCQDLVCGIDPFCCNTSWDAMCAGDAVASCLILCGAPPPITINEIRMDQVGADVDEYFEIAGPPGTSLDDIQYIVIGDIPTGEVEEIIDLTGQVIPPSGFFVASDTSLTLAVPDFTDFVNFENADTTTHMLVGGFSASLSDNLDLDGDGILDSTPWIVALDTVAMVDDPGNTDLPYGPPLNCMADPTCNEINDGVVAPFQVFRCPDGVGMWQIGNQDIATMPATDTPGTGNACTGCGNGVIDMGEDCDDGGESAMCNADCTIAMCGDGVLNMTAMEACDDGGESAMCNADCTVSSCGDGVVNMTAMEDCDDMGESAMCNADCTTAMCGDGVINATAMETCDDSGESAACDDDCTEAMCGDGNFNNTAGEACDDGGRSETCNDDCSIAGCGDGIVNMTAMETCDDMGESADCDDDCTDVMCGDSVLNVTAGEDCDDGGESADCNDDCTESMCGDGVMNGTAGEECDDGNTDDGDGCAADCTEEAGEDSTGEDSTGGDSSTGGGETGVDDTAGDSTGGGETGVTSGPSTVSASASASAGSSGGETDTDDSGGVVPGDEGCNCSTTGDGGSGAPWSVLALFGLGALGRRRRRG